ncbi:MULTISPECIES: 16S rRNA (cytidine(1402)-2'-O)-methyltransferase [unclassified Schaalia]|uniref:16S rRNA (cytidine(1402)-2'-O)-methyltransferase n=1 Tax=unclassified Schaalia TaxID=2691889 RepID=UPI001E3A5FE4|nr:MULTISPECIES: 16S rRNA (cytidine(1402)-2'-O)-methyltransferase [unclassified Schaalia]MCD4549033.1 16S rRNA (cytidine(1402)-2'-O)-methyltransferase [Schaalia sp. lx-260]MCD4557221.1 16S rRNA (cytidine(1402)-2'-O)-methyltransferase [Schaalia sp. lx-100]
MKTTQQARNSAEGYITIAATPIGDIGDASPRFVHALAQADIVAAEDTRRLLALAHRLDVRVVGSLISLHDHNEKDRAHSLVAQAQNGAHVLLVSDAGMPTVSDPGYRVVSEAVEAGVRVTALPGPSAPVTALAVSGLPSDRFSFEGFLPRKEGEAQRFLDGLARDSHTLIFFESPRRLHQSLQKMAQAFGPQRRAVICRELTKSHEEIIRGDLESLIAATENDVLGEITIVVEGYRGMADPADHVGAVLALAAEGMRLKEAAGQVAQATGARKNDLYQAALAHRDLS